MTKNLIGFSLFLSLFIQSSFSVESPCKAKLQQIMEGARQKNWNVASMTFRQCRKILVASGEPMNGGTKAKPITKSDACVLTLDNNGFAKLAVIDSANNFILGAGIDGNTDLSQYMSSQFGHGESASVIFSYLGSKRVFRADLDRKQNTLQIRQWKTGIFSVKYELDYTLACGAWSAVN